MRSLLVCLLVGFVATALAEETNSSVSVQATPATANNNNTAEETVAPANQNDDPRPGQDTTTTTALPTRPPVVDKQTTIQAPLVHEVISASTTPKTDMGLSKDTSEISKNNTATKSNKKSGASRATIGLAIVGMVTFLVSGVVS